MGLCRAYDSMQRGGNDPVLSLLWCKSNHETFLHGEHVDFIIADRYKQWGVNDAFLKQDRHTPYNALHTHTR